ncbi:TetR/AcrR family transcriptional regulator [Sphingomonas sp. SRS2]|uniref:TetR/AcrR family transcriptional regulator n=1 Tax=Sphingomonas sp. SRS2 TaxID=133190 RepID=UPI001364A64E|nr:TetR/AcrR family transcriptional regulator [Sphingomonas sp. SRS2]
MIATVYGQRAYASAAIRERRQRILTEALSLLIEYGPAGMTVGQLTKRAGVGTRTIYHAFGDKEGVMAHAIAAYMEQMRVAWGDLVLGETPEAILAECDRSMIDTLAQPQLVRAFVGLYFTQAPRSALCGEVDQLPVARIRRWFAYAERQGHLLPGLDMEFFVRRHVDADFAILNRWTRDELTDAELPRVYRMNFLATAISVVKGVERDRLVRLIEAEETASGMVTGDQIHAPRSSKG